MVACVVNGIGDGGEVLAVGITGLGEQGFGLGQVASEVVHVDIGLAAVGVVHEVAAVPVGNAGTDEVGGGGIGALHQGLGHVFAVDGEAKGLTDTGIGELGQAVVQANIIGSEVGVDVEFRVILQRGDLGGGHILDHHGLACLPGAVSGVGILHQQQLDGVQLDGSGVAVVGVLGIENIGAGHPLFDVEGAVADIALRLCGPGVAVLLDGGLVHGAQGREGGQLVEVSAGMGQLHHEGGVVGSGNTQRVDFTGGGVGIALHHAQHGLGIGSGGGGIGHALPAVDKVFRGESGAVGPLQVLTEIEGPGEAVGAGFPFFGGAGDNFIVLVHIQQAVEGKNDHVAAVYGAVERGVDGLGIGADFSHQIFGLGSGRGRGTRAGGSA
ncbi:hypothetical protein SDC9_113903 [bioreactor metagenome]|uniref:Uncharacterized protein n=1 Tax=bioreactor metagenome TaxID=1076179 RepID=A0A645BNE7_9ZZZZ